MRVLVLGFAVLALAYVGHAPALILLGFVLALMPVVSVVLAGSDLSGIRVVGSVDAPQLVVGASTPMTLTFATRRSRLPAFSATVEAPHIDADPGWVEGGGVIGAVAVPVTGRSHGFLQHALVQLEHVGPWGLSTTRARAVLELAPWPVVPSTRLVPAPARPAVQPPDGDETGAGRPVTSGTDPRGMRAFRSGDEPRSVNWRATARVGTLTVREWDPPRRIPGVWLVPVLAEAGPGWPRPVAAPGAPQPGERLLGALASLGLAAAADDRSLALTFHGTRVSTDGASLLPTGLQQLSGLGPAELLAGLAGVRPAPAALVHAVITGAVAAVTPGGTVLLGIEVGQGPWSAAGLLATHAAVDAAGCQLEVLVEVPPNGWRPKVRDAFGALADRCPVTPLEAVVVLDRAAEPVPA